MSGAKARQQRIDQLVEALATEAKRLVKAQSPPQDGQYKRLWEQMAAIGRLVGLTKPPAPHDFARAGRLLRCMLALTKRLQLPPATTTGAAAATAAPRPQDLALVECLLRACALEELFLALQQLMPAHKQPANEDQPCNCCSDDTPAWSEPVVFEERAASHAAASTSTSASSTRNTARAATSRKGGPRASVAAVMDSLLLRALAVVVWLTTWIDNAAAAAESQSSASAAGAQVARRLRWVQEEAVRQLYSVPVRCPRDVAPPFTLLQAFCHATITDFTGPVHRAAACRSFDGLPNMYLVMRPVRSHAEAYRRVVALASAQMNMVARVAYMAATPSATATGPTTSATATGESDMRGMFPVVLELSTAWAKQAAHAVHGMSGMEACKQWEPPPQQSLLGGMLPDPFDLVARDLRTVLWCWRVNKGAQGRNSKALASFACGVLGQEGTERWGLSDVSDQKDSPIMLVTAAVLHGQKLPPPSGPTAAGLAALDCLAALAVDAEGARAVRQFTVSDRKFSAVLLSILAAGDASDTSPIWTAGSGRPHLPRASVSGALVFVATGAQLGYIMGTFNSTFPLLMRVLEPLAQQLRQQQDAAGVAQVLAAVPSPADVAAALTATLRALHTYLDVPLKGTLPGVQSVHHTMAGKAPQLAACGTITQALATWLSGSVQGTGCSSSGSSNGSSGAGSTGGGTWSKAHETWRCALQEFGTCSALWQVVNTLVMNGLAQANPSTRALSAAFLEALQPYHPVLLSSSLLKQLYTQRGSAPSAAPAPAPSAAAAPATCLDGPAADLLASREDQALHSAVSLTPQSLTVIISALNDQDTLPPQQQARLLVAAAAEPGGLFVGSCAPVVVSYPAALSLPHLLAAHAWRDRLLAAVLDVGSVISKLRNELQMPANPMFYMMRCVQLLPEMLPLRLAQWVAAVGGEGVGAVVARVMPRDEAEGRGVGAHSLARMYDHNLAVLLAGGEFKGLDTPDDVAAAGRGPAAAALDELAALGGSGEFRALWGWSAEVCSRLVGELHAACEGAMRQEGQGLGQGQGQLQGEAAAGSGREWPAHLAPFHLPLSGVTPERLGQAMRAIAEAAGIELPPPPCDEHVIDVTRVEDDEGGAA